MLNVWNLESFPSHTARNYVVYTAVLYVWARLIDLLKQVTESYDIGMPYLENLRLPLFSVPW
jgi:hypothetical protein